MMRISGLSCSKTVAMCGSRAAVFVSMKARSRKSAQFWVYVIGDRSGHNRVDHNLFEQQRNRGSMLFIRGDDKALAPSQHDQVDHNHFRDVIDAAGANGHETLRTGSNDLGAAAEARSP